MFYGFGGCRSCPQIMHVKVISERSAMLADSGASLRFGEGGVGSGKFG